MEILDGCVVWVTGDEPLKADHMKRIVEEVGGFVATPGLWQLDQIIVIGREEFDVEYLQESIRIGKIIHDKLVGEQMASIFRYMSQEAFFHYVWTGEEPRYYPGDPRVQEHAGLRKLASIGFRWPSTSAPPGLGSGSSYGDYSDASELTQRFGYSVRAGISVSERRWRLAKAIQERPEGMGLEAVVMYLASLVRWRRAQLNERVQGAIDRWEDDLNWLYKEHYLNSAHSFIWPSLEVAK